MDKDSVEVVLKAIVKCAGGAECLDSAERDKGYAELKLHLLRGSETDTDLAEAIGQVERKPHSTARQNVLREELAGGRVTPEAVMVAQSLLEMLAQVADPAQDTGRGASQIDGTSGPHTMISADGDRAAAIGEMTGVLVTGDRNVVFVKQLQPSRPVIPLSAAVTRYRENLISNSRHLHLQGIETGGQLISVDLERVYVALTSIDQPDTVATSLNSRTPRPASESDSVSYQPMPITEALRRHSRLVIVGAPGSGKSTLLSFMALSYAQDLGAPDRIVYNRLELLEAGRIPILLPLRTFGAHLKVKYADESQDGPNLLVTYLHQYYAAQSIQLPEDFFALPLEENRAVVLLDGLDEVAERQLRHRLARIIEKFVARYPGNRYVVTSREAGYEGAARIGAGFRKIRICDFTPEDVRLFISRWSQNVEMNAAGGSGADVLHRAERNANELIRAIEANPSIRALAVNPLLLTVICLVHRSRAALPERRAELYEEAVEVLLARWDEAKGMASEHLVAGRPLDSGDRRALLEPVALHLQEVRQREIETEDLKALIHPFFQPIAGDTALANRAVNAFLELINERSGLMTERDPGLYTFVHQTFQEYLAARAVADRGDFLQYTLSRLHDPWWREVILLEAGYLSTQGRRRVSALINDIMHAPQDSEPDPCYQLLLAAECIHDVGPARLSADLLEALKGLLRCEIQAPLPGAEQGTKRRSQVLRKVAAANALGQIESGQFGASSEFWSLPSGEPKFIKVTAGPFWSEASGRLSRVTVPGFQIAPTPITNWQYALFVSDTGVNPPVHWRGNDVPKGKANHPVECVNWADANAYCAWLTEKMKQHVRLPTELEWAKAARGETSRHIYPWGDSWADYCCNSKELGLYDTSPVGFFRMGASPYGCLDMVGNVWEWCHTAQLKPRRKKAQNQEPVVRGGAFSYDREFVKIESRDLAGPSLRLRAVGFRVVIAD